MDPSPSPNNRPSLLERLSLLLLREPEDREQLLQLLRGAYERNLLDSDALSIIEGALAVSEMQVRDIMVPRAQMDVISIADPPEKIIDVVIETAHSRFPGDRRKQGRRHRHPAGQGPAALLRRQGIRPARHPASGGVHPESKRLNVLLREFRASRNHMAIVVDEYGGVAGLVTIEDVLEQIVGDIEDEYDFDEAADNIVLDNAGHYRVKATTEIDDFNTTFGTTFADEDYDTVGGLVIHHLGRLPKRNEVVSARRPALAGAARRQPARAYAAG